MAGTIGSVGSRNYIRYDSGAQLLDQAQETRVHVPAPLIPLHENGIILSVVRPLMSGKEASVFIVETREGRCVAKVYKEANNRSFRQRSAYSEGRTVRNSRQARAMAKGSKYGKALLEAEWQNAEVSALYRLHDAGVRVPTPYHFAVPTLNKS